VLYWFKVELIRGKICDQVGRSRLRISDRVVHERVCSTIAGKYVGATAADDRVIAWPANQIVIPHIAYERIGSAVAYKKIVIWPAGQCGIDPLRNEHVSGRVSDARVIASVCRSLTNMSGVPLVSPGTRLVA